MMKPTDIFPISLPVRFVRSSVFGNDRKGDFGNVVAANREAVSRHQITDLQPGLMEARIARAEFIATAINNHAALLASLRAVLPYAESRAEDMLEEDGELDGCDPSDATRKAVAAVDAAKALLASLDAGAEP